MARSEKQSALTINYMSVKQWNEEKPLENIPMLKKEDIKYCRLEDIGGTLLWSFNVPDTNRFGSSWKFFLVVWDRNVVLVDDTDQGEKIVNKLLSEMNGSFDKLHFCYDFLIELLSDDGIYLDKIESRVVKVEEYALEANSKNVHQKILELKKEISRYSHFYEQLSDISENILEKYQGSMGDNGVLSTSWLTRLKRLSNKTHQLKEYATSVQEVYQAEIAIRQNDVMKVLTIVTTIFLPLNLLVGWYGMNFKYMPELSWAHAYPLVVLFSLVIVFFSLWIFKKKKFW